MSSLEQYMKSKKGRLGKLIREMDIFDIPNCFDGCKESDNKEAFLCDFLLDALEIVCKNNKYSEDFETIKDFSLKHLEKWEAKEKPRYNTKETKEPEPMEEPEWMEFLEKKFNNDDEAIENINNKDLYREFVE